LASYTRTLGEEAMTTRRVEEDIVIEALKDFPDNVIAIACHGHLTKADYETVLIPQIEDKLKRHKKLRYYTETAPDFVGMDPGAVWGDTKFGFSHWFDWERGAMVTDVEWITRAVKFFSLFGFLMPGEVRVFPTAEASKAREWVVGGGPAARM
jgi:SpoIIAA-like